MRSGRVVVALVLLALLGGAPALAAPVRPRPPNPSDQDLQRGRDAVATGAADVGRLTSRLNDLQTEGDDLRIQVAEQHENANAAVDTLTAAQSAADAAAGWARTARAQTEAAGTAIDVARDRLDGFVLGAYQQGIDLGPLGLLTSATGPADFVDRAQLTDVVVAQQTAALDGLERARVEQANADSRARAAQDEAEARQEAAEQAKQATDAALVQAVAAADTQAQRLAAVGAEQAAVQGRLDAAENADAGLRAQRQRFDAWQRQQSAADAAQQRAAQQGAAARSAGRQPAPSQAGGSGDVQTVIDRAMAQLGVTYAWGGGTAGGPSHGIRDGGVADRMGDYDKIGFDCSGLMLYAFAGVGIRLPRYSGNQHAAGKQVPVSQMRPGDMLSWARDGRTYHIALYIGNGKMVEAPYSGSEVRISPVRYAGLQPTVARML